MNLSATQKKIVELIKENAYINQTEMAEQIGISKRAVQKSIRELVSKELIEREGSSRKGYWKFKE